MAYTKGELRMPEYETSYLLKCCEEIESFFEETDAKTRALILKEERQELIQERLIDGYLAAIDKMVEVRNYDHRKRYCINIKVHSLDLTEEQEWFIYDNWEKMMDLFWDGYILPWINSRKHRPDIYQQGRSGGWLVLDMKVKDWDEGYSVPPDLEEVQGTFQEVKDFREGWDEVFKGMKEDLKTRIDKGETPQSFGGMYMLTKKWKEEELTLEDVGDWLKEQSESERLDYEELIHVADCLYHIYLHDKKGRPVGKFLTYLLENNFVRASGMADDINKKILSVYAKFIYNIAPGDVVKF